MTCSEVACFLHEEGNNNDLLLIDGRAHVATSTTRRCASHHIATQRENRWGHPAVLARLAQTVTLKRLWLRDGHVQRAHSLSPNPRRNASLICPDLRQAQAHFRGIIIS